MGTLPTTPICILAGGASRRFGADKAFAQLQGRPMLDHVLDRLRTQSAGPIAINAGTNTGKNTDRAAAFASFGLPIVSDKCWEGAGPLAGVFSAIQWARSESYETVITLAVDLPFAPLDLVAKLHEAGAPTIATSQDRWHPVNGVWRADQGEALSVYLESGKRSAHGWAEHCGATLANFDSNTGGVDPFWNVNTPEDMAEAQRMLDASTDN